MSIFPVFQTGAIWYTAENVLLIIPLSAPTDRGVNSEVNIVNYDFSIPTVRYKSGLPPKEELPLIILGVEKGENIPAPLLNLPDETLEKLRDGMAVNWLANDGVWFQAVEFTKGMKDAKSCNDSCWGQFSPFEAWSIKRMLNLPENPSLEGLKKALKFRLYAFINEQSFTEETENSYIFRMDECRVQNARKRKGLDDYPCKSGGVVEYTTFASAIDSRIKTTCICCPPDDHPEEYFCAWKFYIDS